MSDETKVFRCPNCKQYINSSLAECKFCKIPLTSEIIQKAIDDERNDARTYHLNNSKKHLYIGIGLFSLGLILSISSYFAGNINGGGGFIFIGLLLLGLGEIGNGFYGLLDHFGDK